MARQATGVIISNSFRNISAPPPRPAAAPARKPRGPLFPVFEAALTGVAQDLWRLALKPAASAVFRRCARLCAYDAHSRRRPGRPGRHNVERPRGALETSFEITTPSSTPSTRVAVEHICRSDAPFMIERSPRAPVLASMAVLRQWRRSLPPPGETSTPSSNTAGKLASTSAFGLVEYA